MENNEKNMQENDPEVARRFVRWHRVKTKIEKTERNVKIKEGEIYWASVGQNVGVEIYGKNEGFTRPVLAYRKLGPKNFMAIPLSSKFRDGSWYVAFIHKRRLEVALINQARSMSVKRLYKCLGEIDEDDFARIKEGFRKLYC